MAISLFAVFAVIAGAHTQQDLVTTPPMPPSPLENHRRAHHPDATYPEVHLVVPDDQTIVDAWPAKAKDDEVEGYAAVDCLIRKDGTLTQCEVVVEAPKGYGFGKATVRLYQNAFSADLSSIPGGWQPNTRVGDIWLWRFSR